MHPEFRFQPGRRDLFQLAAAATGLAAFGGVNLLAGAQQGASAGHSRRRLRAAFSNIGLQVSWCAQGKAAAEYWGRLFNVDVTWFDPELSAALEAMHAYDLPRVAVVALAKRAEEVFVPGNPAPVVLDPASAGLQLIQRIRDEAHRVALRYHRRKRSARSMGTIFEGLQGIGPARRRAIIRHFGSVERFL